MFSGLLQLVNMVVHKATIHFALFEEIVPLCPSSHYSTNPFAWGKKFALTRDHEPRRI